MEKLKVTRRAERDRRETANSNLQDDAVERTAVVAATPAKSALFSALNNSTVDIQLPQNLFNDVIIIKHSSTPECWLAYTKSK